jgi:hypothetical protein
MIDNLVEGQVVVVYLKYDLTNQAHLLQINGMCTQWLICHTSQYASQRLARMESDQCSSDRQYWWEMNGKKYAAYLKVRIIIWCF